jgi:hypothetical protein
MVRARIDSIRRYNATTTTTTNPTPMKCDSQNPMLGRK